MDNNKQRAISIWQNFCQELENTGVDVLNNALSDSELDQAEGLRYITRLLRNGLEFKLEGAQPEWPQLFSYAHETIKMGADNPDIRYLNCFLSPKYDYKITGTRGSVNQLNLSTHAGGYGDDNTLRLTGSLASENLVTNADGSIEIILSKTEQAQNWLPMQAASNMLIIRQIFLDRKKEQAANLTIERISNHSNEAAHQLTLSEVESGLNNACATLKGTANLFTEWGRTWLPHSNELPFADQQYCQDLGGDPNIIYYHSHWALADDEALIIHLPKIPECENWNLQINNVWMESLDYRFHQIHFNKHTAQENNNSAVTMVLTHQNPKTQNPNILNWLNTTGHNEGLMTFRWVGCKEVIHPQVEKCTVSELTNRIKNIEEAN